MTKKFRQLYFFVVLLCMCLNVIIPVGGNSPLQTASENTRENTMWATGYMYPAENNSDSFLPWAVHPAYGATFMYETLFGWNALEKNYIPSLGETIAWEGNIITIKLWDQAKWTGPGVNQGIITAGINDDITALDVIYSFQLLNGSRWGNFNDRIVSITQGVTDKHVVITLKTEFAYSALVKEWLTSDIPIVSKAIWEDINADYGLGPTERINSSDFKNRWDNVIESPVKWHITSGPYTQTGDPEDISSFSELYKKNTNWWGNGILYRDIMGSTTDKALGSAVKTENLHPEYIGIKFYPGEDAAISAIKTGLIDQSAIRAPKFKDIQAQKGDDVLHLWFADDDVRSYNAQGSNIELTFNTRRYPMSELWFRKAISKAIDFRPISSVASGNNWLRGSPTYLNSQYNLAHLDVFDQAIHDDYMFEYDPIVPKNLFIDAGAYEKEVYTKNKWFIDAPQNSSVPLATNYDYDSVIDADPDKTGKQVEIGPYLIFTPRGWTDTTITVDYWAKSISETLDIQVEKNEVDYELWETKLINNTYDLAMWNLGAPTQNNPFQLFRSLAQNQSKTGNISSWRGSGAKDFKNALMDYEVATTSEAQEIAASKMQRAYAQNLPTIPSHIECYYYQYSSQYWKGWNTQGWQYNQPCTTDITNQIVIKQRLTLALAPEYVSWNPPANFSIMTGWPEGPECWCAPENYSWIYTVIMGGILIIGGIGIIGMAIILFKKYRPKFF